MYIVTRAGARRRLEAGIRHAQADYLAELSSSSEEESDSDDDREAHLHIEDSGDEDDIRVIVFDGSDRRRFRANPRAAV